MDSLSLGPTVEEIRDAHHAMAGAVHRTPLERSGWLSDLTGQDVWLKLECWQRTRSFKMRGAFNAVRSLSAAERARGLVTASAGNHGQALALAARELGATATIYVPHDAPETKKARIRSYHAILDAESPNYDDAELAALAFAEETGRTFVNAYSDRNVVAGQGTVALEILEDLPEVTHIVVPVGGGGLIAGIGIAAKSMRSIRITGVQSTHTTAMYDAFQAGQMVESPVPPTLADGLSGQVDEISFARARAVVDEMLLTSETAIPAAIRKLFTADGVVAEGAAATSVAAICEGALKLKGRTVLVITGGNIDAARFASILGTP